MTNIKNYEYDCTIKCQYREHGNRITAALTKRSISNEMLAAFIAKTCRNFTDNVDDLGRSAVNMAASVGRYAVLEWLLNQGVIINSRDFETGSSALHRAIYYGCIDCAVLLLRYGASLDVLDKDARTPLYNVCRLIYQTEYKEVLPQNEVLVWGTNKNYNLGIGNEVGCSIPQSIEFFRKQHISLKSIALGAYHTLFLDNKSQLYAVGHGKGGRLGIKTEDSLPLPKKLKLPLQNVAEIICISVSSQHSLLLTNKSTVHAAGQNTHKQLGVPGAVKKVTTFKEVVCFKEHLVEPLVAVIAKDYYSIAYSTKQVFFWGTNYGQMGMNEDVKVVPYAKVLKFAKCANIVSIVASNFATAILTEEKNIIWLFYNYKIKSLKSPTYELIKSISVEGGDNSTPSKGSASGLKLIIVTNTNLVFIWFETTQLFYSCTFSPQNIQIDKIFHKGNQVLLLSDGDVYSGKCHQVPLPINKSNDKFVKSSSIWSPCERHRLEVATEHMTRIDYKRIAHIDRAVDLFCGDDFSTFAVLLMPEKYTFKKLFHDTNEFDTVHDVVFHVDNEVYAAHKVIIYARATGLRDIINASTDKHIYLNFDDFSGKMLEIILKYIYTNYFPISEDFDDIQHSLSRNNSNKRILAFNIFLLYVEKFQLYDLANYLKCFLENSNSKSATFNKLSKPRFKPLQRSDFPELYDVRIVCADDVVLSAHKCILLARLEYFEMMFSHTWSEQQTINLQSVPVMYMEPILDFLYSSDVEHFRKQNYTESFLYNMIVFCDQFFVERLLKVCEILLLDKITIRKCGDMLDFAQIYNCETLKLGCLNFVCQNLERVLTQKSLENCDAETLNCINAHYREMFQDVFDYRMITPDSEAVDDDLLCSFVDDFQVNLDYRMNEDEDCLNKTASTQKQSEFKFKQTTRQHEHEAINSMMKTLNFDDKPTKDEKTKAIEEIKDIAEKFKNEANT